jgi:LysM repeat protein
MSDNKPAPDPNKKPRRALTSEERAEIFREFRLGLIALAVLVVLVVTLCWDRGGSSASAAARARESQRINLSVELKPLPRPPGFDNRIGLEGGRGDLPPVPPNNNAVNVRPAPPVNHIQPPAPPVVAPPPPPPQPRFRDYVVQRGDTSLWKIASRTMGQGSRWPLIKEANPGLDPTRMKIGQVLRIPLPMVRTPALAPAGHAYVSMTTPAPAAPTSPETRVASVSPQPAAGDRPPELATVVPIDEPAGGNH